MERITWTPGVTLEEVERQVILMAFRFYRGNQTTTAIALGIDYKTLTNKLGKYRELDEQRAEDDKHRDEARDAFLRRQRGIPDHGPAPFITNRPLPERAAQVKTNADPASRNGVESAPHVAEKQPVPVPERKEVQGVLPSHAPQGGSRKSR